MDNRGKKRRATSDYLYEPEIVDYVVWFDFPVAPKSKIVLKKLIPDYIENSNQEKHTMLDISKNLHCHIDNTMLEALRELVEEGIVLEEKLPGGYYFYSLSNE